MIKEMKKGLIALLCCSASFVLLMGIIFIIQFVNYQAPPVPDPELDYPGVRQGLRGVIVSLLNDPAYEGQRLGVDDFSVGNPIFVYDYKPWGFLVSRYSYPLFIDGTVVATAEQVGSIEGFGNRNNVTELLTIIKDGEGNNVDLEKYSVRLLFTDGERIRENGGWVSAAMKLSDMQPSSKDEGLGLWRFNVCEAKGENQFIPQYDSSYVITVMLYDENGVLAYSGKSAVNKFKVNEEPIFEERTATPSLDC